MTEIRSSTLGGIRDVVRQGGSGAGQGGAGDSIVLGQQSQSYGFYEAKKRSLHWERVRRVVGEKSAAGEDRWAGSVPKGNPGILSKYITSGFTETGSIYTLPILLGSVNSPSSREGRYLTHN